MSRKKLVPYNRPFVRAFRPSWTWMNPPNFRDRIYRTNLHIKSEFVYVFPAIKAKDFRRATLMQCLERSDHEDGFLRQHSGYGIHGTSTISGSDSRRNHFSDIYDEVDPDLSKTLGDATHNTFPIKRLHHICNLHEFNSKKHRTGPLRSSPPLTRNEDIRGPFPYVDEKATVLGELNRAEILRTRHRVNTHSHPRWVIRTLRQRKRKHLLRMKRRSISQERIRSLQAQLISSKPAISES